MFSAEVSDQLRSISTSPPHSFPMTVWSRISLGGKAGPWANLRTKILGV